MTVALHVASDDCAVEDVEGGEQRRRAMTLVVVGHCPGPTRLHRQARLGAIEGLDLALLVDRQDQRRRPYGLARTRPTTSRSFSMNRGVVGEA